MFKKLITNNIKNIKETIPNYIQEKKIYIYITKYNYREQNKLNKCNKMILN